MSWRWRRTMRSGPFRITFSKKGIGYSVGIPGLRYGRSPTGKKYVSQGIPGTGFYRIKYFGKQPRPTVGAPTPSGPGPTVPVATAPASTRAAGPGPLSRAVQDGARGLWLMTRRGIALTIRLAGMTARRVAYTVDQMRTRQRAGWTYTPPPLNLPAQGQLPGTSQAPAPPAAIPPTVGTAAPASGSTAPASQTASTPPAAAPDPWWRQKPDE